MVYDVTECLIWCINKLSVNKDGDYLIKVYLIYHFHGKLWWNGKKGIKTKGWTRGCEEIEIENRSDMELKNRSFISHLFQQYSHLTAILPQIHFCITLVFNSAVANVFGEPVPRRTLNTFLYWLLWGSLISVIKGKSFVKK